jgi:hypothetical protein
MCDLPGVPSEAQKQFLQPRCCHTCPRSVAQIPSRQFSSSLHHFRIVQRKPNSAQVGTNYTDAFSLTQYKVTQLKKTEIVTFLTRPEFFLARLNAQGDDNGDKKRLQDGEADILDPTRFQCAGICISAELSVCTHTAPYAYSTDLKCIYRIAYVEECLYFWSTKHVYTRKARLNSKLQHTGT